jgi:RNA polymerase sigma-70 factor, ECF subfamily
LKADTHTASSDLQLIEAAAHGDKRAFTLLVKRYEDLVYRYSFKVCRNTEEAREALQDTFISVHRNLRSFDGRSKFSTWLYRIVTNNCLMKHRRRKLDALLESYDDPQTFGERNRSRHIARWDETPADILLKKEFKTILDRAILKLPVDYRAAFVLRDIEGNSTEETAGILKISEEATKSRLRRARAFLRDQLSPYMTRTGGSS